jgi:hypothetical protein
MISREAAKFAKQRPPKQNLFAPSRLRVSILTSLASANPPSPRTYLREDEINDSRAMRCLIFRGWFALLAQHSRERGLQPAPTTKAYNQSTQPDRYWTIHAPGGMNSALHQDPSAICPGEHTQS